MALIKKYPVVMTAPAMAVAAKYWYIGFSPPWRRRSFSPKMEPVLGSEQNSSGSLRIHGYTGKQAE